ncbi:MAG: dephospho-CoA kinase [Gammaproteobacteria bacterium]|nr:dephospho-CoA kinase [Pseudomonadales bacterium]MCP5345577.1 dephospho-CoA kinase [Pseudomonadales bacterium]
MLVVGLTGGIGSGKSTVAELFADKGIEIVDADLIARQVVQPGKPALQQIAGHFGAGILDTAGSLRRQALRELVFARPEERLWLEQLLHPLINAEIHKLLAETRSPYCVLVSPLLLETRQKDLADRVLVVDVSRETQLRRSLRRDYSSRETIEAIIDSQISRTARLEAADDVIDNEGSLADLMPLVDSLHSRYLELAGTGDTSRKSI